MKQLKQKIKEREEETKKKNEAAFNEFVSMKELRDRAIKCLRLMPKPTTTYFRDQTCQTTQSKDKPIFAVRNMCMCALKDKCVGCCDNSEKPKKTYVNPVLMPNDLSDSPEVSLCIAVGKALKGVDRTLFLEWADWCNFIFSREVASTLWDYFTPRSCEVHSSSHSQVG